MLVKMLVVTIVVMILATGLHILQMVVFHLITYVIHGWIVQMVLMKWIVLLDQTIHLMMRTRIELKKIFIVII